MVRLTIRSRFLAPLWVVPDYHGRGVASLLLKEVFDIADAQDPPTPLFLESAPDAKTFYPKLGFEFVPVFPDPKHPDQMVRRGPKEKPGKLLN